MTVLIIIGIFNLIFGVVVIVLILRNGGANQQLTRLEVLQTQLDKNLQDGLARQRQEMSVNLAQFEQKQANLMTNNAQLLKEQFEQFGKEQTAHRTVQVASIKDIRNTIEKQLEAIRVDNNHQLKEVRKTVDEKLHETLEKRLGESFKQVSDRLEQVHKGLGEMQTLATGVGDLKKVLSNVKTRGVLGEYQLANILSELLAPHQYESNVITKKHTQQHVEFAVKLPGKDADDVVWMPIDSKFPIEPYQQLLSAYDVGDKAGVDYAQKVLAKAVESFAKDIATKYINPPKTTDFAILFLPIESLYAEILRYPSLFEKLQTQYRITITGPTTLSALLNSLQMGFRTLAVQERSSEVWKILEAVKTEFEKWSIQLDKVDKQLVTASKSLNELRSTRTNVISRKLHEVGTIDTSTAEHMLDLPNREED